MKDGVSGTLRLSKSLYGSLSYDENVFYKSS
jgi:hypothetical protein